MSDITTLGQMSIVIAATVTPVTALVRLFSGSQAADEDVARRDTAGAAWPIACRRRILSPGVSPPPPSDGDRARGRSWSGRTLVA